MHLLYDLMCKAPGSSLLGTYSKMKHIHQPQKGTGDASRTWRRLVKAFKVLEDSFKRFDTNGDGAIDKIEISRGIPIMRGSQKVTMISILETSFLTADVNRRCVCVCVCVCVCARVRVCCVCRNEDGREKEGG